MIRRFVIAVLALVVAAMAPVQPRTAEARDILLIDDFAGGFGPTAGLLTAQGHTVTELTGEVAAGYSRVSDTGFLSGFDFVIYAARHDVAPPATANSALEAYIQGGGDLLVTGFGSGVDIPDRSAPDLLRALGPEFSYFVAETDHAVSTIDNFITNGLHGDFRGQALANSNGFEQLFANTGLGTVPLVQGAGGQPDKVLFTDLAASGGSVGAWQGGNRFDPNAPAQPDFFDGGTFQGLLLNWAEGGTTSQKAVTPDVFSTDAHPIASTVSIDLYVGDPNVDGAFVATLGPLPVHGTVDVVGAVDALGNGTLALTNSSLVVSDVTNFFVDLGGLLGTMLVDINNLELYVANQPTSVAAFDYDLTSSPYYVAGLTHAEVSIHSPTGLLATLLDGMTPVELLVDNVFYGSGVDFPDGVFEGTFDDGPGHFTSLPEVNLTVDNASLFLFHLSGLGDVYGVVRGDFHLAVPEPTTMPLAAVAMMAGVAFAARRQVRARRRG